jgi:Lipocalin-like domain
MISGIPVRETLPSTMLINNISGGFKIATSVRVCMNDEQLVGAWGLVSWENRAADGGVSYPMGADARGYLIYSRDGRFSVTISRANRVGFTGDDLLGGTVLEKANAAQSFVAYAGRYTLAADQVIHHVELSLFPNWVGTQQQRFVELSRDTLILSANPMLLAGKQQVPRLVWQRVRPLR